MWQMWQMPRASGGPPEVEKFFSARSKLENPARYVGLDTITVHLPCALGYMIREETLALKAWNLSVVLCTHYAISSVIIVA